MPAGGVPVGRHFSGLTRSRDGAFLPPIAAPAYSPRGRRAL